RRLPACDSRAERVGTVHLVLRHIGQQRPRSVLCGQFRYHHRGALHCDGRSGRLGVLCRAQLSDQPVPGARRRQPGPEPGNLRLLDAGHRGYAHLPAGLHGDGRLLQHQDRRLHRDDADLQNIASDKVQGIDAEVNYDKDLSDFGWTHFGSLSINAAGTLATVNNTSIPGTPTLHCLGVYGPSCGEPQNRFKSHVRLTWTDNKGDFALSLNWRHLSSITFEGNLPSTIAPGFGFTNNPTLGWGAFDYFDLSGTWSVTDAIDLRAGVRNLLDKDPPLT